MAVISKLYDDKFEKFHPKEIYRGYIKEFPHSLAPPVVGRAYPLPHLKIPVITEIVEEGEKSCIFKTEEGMYKIEY